MDHGAEPIKMAPPPSSSFSTFEMDHGDEPIKMAPPPSSSFATFEMNHEPPKPPPKPHKSVSFAQFQSRPQQRPPPSIVFEPLKDNRPVPYKQYFELGQGSGAYRPPPKSVSYATVEIGEHEEPLFHGRPHPPPHHHPVHSPPEIGLHDEPFHNPEMHFRGRPAPVHITVPPPVEGSHLEPAINLRPDIPSVHDFSSSFSNAELSANFESLFDNFDVSLFDFGGGGGGGIRDDPPDAPATFRDFGHDLHDGDGGDHPDHYSYHHDGDHYSLQHHPKDPYRDLHDYPKYPLLPEKDYHPELPHFQDYSRPPSMFQEHHAETPTAMPPFLETGPFVVSGPAEYGPPPLAPLAQHEPRAIQARHSIESFLHPFTFKFVTPNESKFGRFHN